MKKIEFERVKRLEKELADYAHFFGDGKELLDLDEDFDISIKFKGKRIDYYGNREVERYLITNRNFLSDLRSKVMDLLISVHNDKQEEFNKIIHD